MADETTKDLEEELVDYEDEEENAGEAAKGEESADVKK
jgi:hypothetical protein